MIPISSGQNRIRSELNQIRLGGAGVNLILSAKSELNRTDEL